jgi:thiol-disulfide isomerase/thioredoxin
MRKSRPLTKNPTLLTAVLSLATLAGYAAYRLTLGGPDVPESDAVEMVQDRVGPPLADALPDIAFNDLGGAQTPLSTWAGRPLLINFWATWCAPCLREIPLLKTFGEEHPSIQVLGIAVDDLDDVRKYADEMQFTYPVLVGQSEAMNAMAVLRNDAGVMPFSVFTAPDGAVLAIHAGELHSEHLELLSATLAALQAGTIDRDTAREQLGAVL